MKVQPTPAATGTSVVSVFITLYGSSSSERWAQRVGLDLINSLINQVQ